MSFRSRSPPLCRVLRQEFGETCRLRHSVMLHSTYSPLVCARRASMYWFHDAEYRAAKAAMIAYMDQGYRWNEAAQLAGVVISRATAYRLWLRSWREGPSCLDDGRH